MNDLDPAPQDANAVIAALDDPTRRALYRFVAEAGREVGRDEAASAVGARRGTVAFHLDKLVEAGLLDVQFRRLNERAGPGAGRPAKLYRAPHDDVEFSVPPRRYAVAGEIMSAALDAIPGPKAEAAVRHAAAEHGRRIAAAVRTEGLAALSLVATLTSLGYEPEIDANGDVAMRNCPFHALVQRSRQRTCSMNQAFVDGILDGLGDNAHRAELTASPGYCCVRLTRTPQGEVVA